MTAQTYIVDRLIKLEQENEELITSAKAVEEMLLDEIDELKSETAFKEHIVDTFGKYLQIDSNGCISFFLYDWDNLDDYNIIKKCIKEEPVPAGTDKGSDVIVQEDITRRR